MFRKPGSVFTCLALLTSAGISFAQVPASLSPASSETAKVWMERRAEIEAYLVSAPVLDMEDVPVGVTRPKRARLAPGGPVEYIAWKHVPPGRPYGFWESYKSEIAAYALDQLLQLDMVPPTVEKRVNGELGAAVMWCSPTRSFKELGGVPRPPSQYAGSWNRQLVRAKMFDNLIGNKDPNLGNWLVDPSWNLVLIDHTRAFTPDTAMAHKKMDRIDRDLWENMDALTLEGLTAALARWLDKGQMRAILTRRDRMRQDIQKMIAAQGADAVFIR